jgi:hypothetical protein
MFVLGLVTVSRNPNLVRLRELEWNNLLGPVTSSKPQILCYVCVTTRLLSYSNIYTTSDESHFMFYRVEFEVQSLLWISRGECADFDCFCTYFIKLNDG